MAKKGSKATFGNPAKGIEKGQREVNTKFRQGQQKANRDFAKAEKKFWHIKKKRVPSWD